MDAAGVVYLAVPYEWQEEMWTGLLYERGHGLSGLLANGVACPAVASSATYSVPVRLDSVLTCRLYVAEVRDRSFGLRMEASLPDGVVALSVNTRHVWCRMRGSVALEPSPLPDWLCELLAGESQVSPR